MALNEAYGALAAGWAKRLSPDLPLITFEFATIAQAFPDAVRRRRRGESFLASLLLEDPRTKTAIEHAAPSILAQARDYDHAREIYEALAFEKLVSPGGLPQTKWITFDPRFIQGSFELLMCAETVVFRSVTEANRVQAGYRRFPSIAYSAPLDERVPEPPKRSQAPSQIVVWAPDLSALQCSLFAFALEEIHLPATIISSGGPLPKCKARFVELADAADALADAIAILDGSLYDPGSARALAGWDVPLACASTSGAHDWLQGVAVYDPWSYESVFEAIANALGGPLPRALRSHEPEAELRAALKAGERWQATDGPLVTCVVPTYNRPGTLAIALESIAAQTYKNYEVIVVNDAGSPVDDVVARFERMRLLDLTQNVGMAQAVNAGAREGAGTYLALLADDDEFFPDHFARLVYALERSGASVASTGELGIHHERRSDGTLELTGYSTVRTVPACYTRLLLQNMIGGPSIMLRRTVFLDAGGFDREAGHLADFAAWMKLAEHYDFVHVDRLTAIMNFRRDASQLSAISGVATADLYRKIYGALPNPARAGIDKARSDHLSKIAELSLVQAQPTTRVAPVQVQPL